MTNATLKEVISRTWAYHGTTMAAMSATGISSYWPMFEPRTPGFLHIDSPYPYRFAPPPGTQPDDLRTQTAVTPCAVSAWRLNFNARAESAASHEKFAACGNAC